jgi:hypothetical protein
MKTDWMDEEDGIPHKNGHVRFYVVGFNEDIYGYLGWFDMADWTKGWAKVWKAAKERSMDDEQFQVLRHDQLIDLKRNVDNALEEALADKDETTWLWWYNKRREMELKSKGEQA